MTEIDPDYKAPTSSEDEAQSSGGAARSSGGATKTEAEKRADEYQKLKVELEALEEHNEKKRAVEKKDQRCRTGTTFLRRRIFMVREVLFCLRHRTSK